MLILSVLGCTSQPVYNVNNEFVPTLRNGSTPSFDQVEKAILSAAYNKGWSPRIIEPGLIEARIAVRAHKATVEISYSESSYNIRYKNSSNLDHENGLIHRRYNNWIIHLSNAIHSELGVTS